MLFDYDVDIKYNPRKANKVANMLSQNAYDILRMMKLPRELVWEIKDL